MMQQGEEDIGVMNNLRRGIGEGAIVGGRGGGRGGSGKGRASGRMEGHHISMI